PPDPDADIAERVVKRIAFPAGTGMIRDTVTAGDLSAVYVATDKGIAVIDATTLQQYDVDQSTPEVDMIALPGDGRATALALDPGGKYLYVAGTDAIYIIDLSPASDKFMQVADVIGSIGAPSGYIQSMAVSADGH